MINLECWGRSLGRGLEWEVWPYFVHDGIVLGTHADDGILVVVLLMLVEGRGKKLDGSKGEGYLCCAQTLCVGQGKKR
jgi:hypothetical protein